MSGSFLAAAPPRVRVSPLASGDDGAHVSALLAAGFALTLAAGTYNVTSTIDTSSLASASIHLEAGAIINANVPSGPVFRADTVTGRADPSGGATTTNGATVVGARSFVVHALNGLVAGQAIVLVNSTLCQFETHIVRSVSGTTVNLREPIERVFASGSSVKVLTGLPALSVTGEPGSKIGGAATIALQLMGAKGCHFAGLTIAGAWSSWAMFFDWSTRDSAIEDCTFIADAVTPGAVAIGFEMTVNCYARRIDVDQSAGQFAGKAFSLQSAVNSWIEDSNAPGSITGLAINCSTTGGNFDSGGARHSGAVRCNFADATGQAIYIIDGGTDLLIEDCDAPRCASSAVAIDAPNTGAFPTHVTVSGGRLQGTSNGVQVVGGSDLIFRGVDVSGSGTGVNLTGNGTTARVLIDDVNADDCTSVGFAAVGSSVSGVELRSVSAKRAATAGLTFSCVDITIKEIDVTDSSVTVSGGTQISATGATRVVLEDALLGFSGDPSNNVYCLNESGGGDWNLSRVRIVVPTSPAHFLVGISPTAGVYQMRDVRLVAGVAGAGGGGNYGILSNGGTVFDLGDCDFSVATTPYSLDPSTLTNWAQWTATGSAVTVSSLAAPGAQWTARFSLVSASGTVGAPFQATALSAGSANFNSTNAADRSTYRVTLQ